MKWLKMFIMLPVTVWMSSIVVVTVFAVTYRYIPLPLYYSEIEKLLYEDKFDSESLVPLEMYDALLSKSGFDSKWESRGVETWIDKRVLYDYKDYGKWYKVGTHSVNNKLTNLVSIKKGEPYSFELVSVFPYPEERLYWSELFGIKRLEWDRHSAHSELNKEGDLTDIDFIPYTGKMKNSGNIVSEHMSDDWQVDVITLAPRMLEEVGYSLAGMRLLSTNIVWGYYQYDGAVRYNSSVDTIRVVVIDLITGMVVRNDAIAVLSKLHQDWFPQYWELDIGYRLFPYDHYVATLSFGHKINFVNKTSNNFYTSLGLSIGK